MNNRIYKFRAWDKIKQRWCLCEELMWCISSNPFTSGGGGIFELDESNREQDSAWNIGTSYDLMQFTGLYDRFGKEIYEGDILYLLYPRRTEEDEDVSFYIKVVIKFNNGCFWFWGEGYTDCNWHFYNAENREVIGNIFENPELMEEK